MQLKTFQNEQRSLVVQGTQHLLIQQHQIPIDCSDYDKASQMTRPIGQKATKRKIERKAVAMSSNNINLAVMKKVAIERNVIMLKMVEAREKEAFVREANAKAREGENEAKWYEIIVNVTTTMYET